MNIYNVLYDIEVEGWNQGHDHVHDLGKEIDVGPEVGNIFVVIGKEIEVDHGETNLLLSALGDMIAGT